MVEVLALVGNLVVQVGDGPPDQPAAVTALLLAGKAALCSGEFDLGLLEVPRGFHHLPLGGDEEVGVGA